MLRTKLTAKPTNIYKFVFQSSNMRLVIMLDSSTVFMGKQGRDRKTNGNGEGGKMRGNQEAQRTDSMSSSSESLKFVINSWSCFASIMSCMYIRQSPFFLTWNRVILDLQCIFWTEITHVCFVGV